MFQNSENLRLLAERGAARARQRERQFRAAAAHYAEVGAPQMVGRVPSLNAGAQ